MELGLIYRTDPRELLELASADPSLYATMLDVAEELSG